MFCSKCGKTLAMDAIQCPHCGMNVGESRFEGSPYTSAQSHIMPGDDVRKVITHEYTRVNYTSAPQTADQGDVDARTTYRPTFDGDFIPEEMRKDIQASIAPEAENAPEIGGVIGDDTPDGLSQEAVDTLNAVNDELKMDEVDYTKFRARPIESAGQSGISSDVSEMMQELQNETGRRSRRRKPVVYGDYTEDSENTVEGEASGMNTEQPEVFNDIDEEEFEELRHSNFGIAQILKIIAVMVVVAALFVGGVMWFRYIRANHNTTPIENVREELYTGGVELIKKHASTEYVQDILLGYTQSGSSLTGLSVQLDASTAEVAALKPEDATENEQLFLDALKQIQSNIVNCLITDAMALGSGNELAVAESETRWTVVTNSIAMLEKAASAGELTAIINGEVVDVVELEATPSPEPKVNYNTLSKGDKSDEVLNMQNRLFELGYLNDDRDGAFGGKTQTAVKMFQQVAGLPITGIADNDTLNALYASDAPRPDMAAQVTPPPQQ